MAAIYHFFCKSKDEFIHRRRRGNAFLGPNVHLDAALAGIDQYGRQLPHGTVKDDLALKTLTRLVPFYNEKYGADAPTIQYQ